MLRHRWFRSSAVSSVGIGIALGAACKHDEPQVASAPPAVVQPPAPQEPEVTPEQAREFMAKVDGDLRRLWTQASRAEWAKSTDITDANEAAAAAANAEVMAYESNAILESRRFDPILSDLDPATRRQIHLLRLTSTLPAPNDDAKRKELAEIAAKLEGMYGKGEVCKEGKCRDLEQLSAVLASNRKYEDQLEAWESWHSVAIPMRPLYTRLVELANQGAQDIGYADVGELWRSRYDMTPVAFEQDVGRLWSQVEPLYEQLHCHVRAELHERYGDKVSATAPIPAHLLGNMWAQDWSNLYPMLEPYPGEPSIDVTKALKKKKYDAIKMVRLGESFFTSLGLNALPETFWERSMFVQPKDRKAVCHASAWDVELNNDLRIKMCIKVDHEDLVTVHHELGHNYYYNNYYTLPVLFQSGANDGFHEAIGDAIVLSITPNYLKQIGLLQRVSTNDKGVVNKQMQDGLAGIAFLPFGLMIDKWRWDVFAGKIKPSEYNASWWKLRREIQGVDSPMARNEVEFDPGAKYHIPSNVPYIRYFLARVLQFQFHKALCEAAGQSGPLHECSVFGSKAAGDKFRAMLALGASEPWPDALEKLTGKREMDATAMVEYFNPLMAYLQEQNKGRSCGWQ